MNCILAMNSRYCCCDVIPGRLTTSDVIGNSRQKSSWRKKPRWSLVRSELLNGVGRWAAGHGMPSLIAGPRVPAGLDVLYALFPEVSTKCNYGSPNQPVP